LIDGNERQKKWLRHQRLIFLQFKTQGSKQVFFDGKLEVIVRPSRTSAVIRDFNEACLRTTRKLENHHIGI